MKIDKFFYALLLSGLFSIPASAQYVLTLREAVETALKNNYGIRLVKNDLAIARNNVNPGNAGMLPVLEGTFSELGGRQDITRTQSSGNEQSLNGVRNTSMGFGVGLGWTIFDGLQMFTNYERLKELERQGETSFRSTVLQTIGDVVAAYFTVLKEQKLVVARDSALDVSKLRMSIASNKLSVGRGSQLDVITANVDYNTDTTVYLQEQNVLADAKIELNRLMARDVGVDFYVKDSISVRADIQYSALLEQVERLNPALQNAIISNKIARLNLKGVKGQRYPVIALNGGYEVQRNTSPTGFNIEQRSNGFTYGLTARVNIFNGFLQRQNERNAKLEVNSSEIGIEETRQRIIAQLSTSFEDYKTSLSLLEVQENNLSLAKQGLDITLEKYRLGSIPPLELREAQRNYIDAVTRYFDSQYQAKLSEVALREISGTLDIQ